MQAMQQAWQKPVVPSPVLTVGPRAYDRERASAPPGRGVGLVVVVAQKEVANTQDVPVSDLVAIVGAARA